MKLRLQDVLDNLLIGEFSQTGWAADGEFSIATVNKIIVLINAAMADISSRFWVKRKEVFLQTCKGQTLYVIDQSVASKQSKLQGGCYLTTSTGEIFEDDLQEIYEIYDEAGRELRIGVDAGEPHAVGRTCGCGNKIISQSQFDNMCECCKQKRYVNTLDEPGTIVTRRHPYGVPNDVPRSGRIIQLAAYNTIRVPDDFEPQRLRIIYRASARRLKKVSDDGTYFPEKIYLDVPMEYLQAILYYIASRKFNPNMQGVQQGFHEGNNYYQKYIAACALLTDQGAGVEPVGNHGSKFERSGFV